MSTIKLFYEQPDAREIEARVVRIDADGDGRFSVILDRTNFYPEGGGQPCDTGSIGGLAVVSVTESAGEVRHRVAATADELKAAGVDPGATARSVVDLERRIDHSEQHTAQHLLSAVLLRMTGAATLSFHLGERYSSIDIDIPPLERADADAVDDEVMRVIRDDYKVITHECAPEEASRFPLRKEPAVETGVLRVVELDGLEYSACCGTHVCGTGAIGSFRITKVEKYKAGCRVHFVAGGRAFADYRRLAGLVRDASAVAGTSEDELAGVVSAYRERMKGLERSLDEAREAAAEARASALDGSSSAGSSSAGPVVFAEADSVDAASRLARALARRGRVSVVWCVAELKAVAGSPVPSEPGARAVDAIFGAMARDLGGKGGGSRTFFQAAFADAETMARFIAAARLA